MTARIGLALASTAPPRRFPGIRFASLPPADSRPRRGPGASTHFPGVRWSVDSAPPAAGDGPPVMPETRCVSKNWGWWPGAESNHRHADFQYDGDPSSARPSRRTETDFSGADRTAPPDRTYPEPEAPKTWPKTRVPDPFQRVRCVATELFPNPAPNATPLASGLLVRRRENRSLRRKYTLRALLDSNVAPDDHGAVTYFCTVLASTHAGSMASSAPNTSTVSPATRSVKVISAVSLVSAVSLISR